MRIHFSKAEQRFTILDDTGVLFTCKMTNNVRNELNHRRVTGKAKEVVRTVLADNQPGRPYMPRPFPSGNWHVVAVEVNQGNPMDKSPGFTARQFSTQEFGDVRITTDSHQTVETWSLDASQGYAKKDGQTQEDYGYHFHFAPNSKTTLGCGRFESQIDAEQAAGIIAARLAIPESIDVEVV